MADIKNSWKNTGAGLGGAFKSLGKTLVNTGKKGVDKAVEWAEREDTQQPAEAVSAAEAAAPPKTASPDAFVADEIRKLAALRDEGILTEEEFAAKKQQLLS